MDSNSRRAKLRNAELRQADTRRAAALAAMVEESKQAKLRHANAQMMERLNNPSVIELDVPSDWGVYGNV